MSVGLLSHIGASLSTSSTRTNVSDDTRNTKEIMELQNRSAEAIRRLVAIMARLRGPDGCPWDREQTLDSLKPYLIEEAYEVLEAMDAGDSAEHCEELGDLLLQIVFHAELARESGRWDFADVAQAISDKLVYRHPHVFGEERARDAEEVERNWARLKAAEKAKKKGRAGSALDGIPRQAPALLRAERTGEKASRIGFDWPDASGPRAKIDEELRELDEAIAERDAEAIFREVGDVLFSVANLARHLRVPPEDALRAAIARFEGRFHRMEDRLRAEGHPPGEPVELDRLDALWNEVKSE